MKYFFKNTVIKILTWQAMHVLGRFSPKVIAVTGSVGKTSTTGAIYHFLNTSFKVRKSEKSFNSEIGVPLTILGLKNAWTNPIKWIWNLIKGFFIAFFSMKYPEVLILEVGADKPGDIKNITSWLKPDIAVVTALPDVPVHVENFPSPDSVYGEKAELIRALPKEGIAVLNEDDERVMKMKEFTEVEVVVFGTKNSSDIYMPLVANPYPIFAGAVVAEAMGLSKERIKELSRDIQTPPGRMSKIKGINNSVIIDDSYNSSPFATESALRTLQGIKNEGRKIVALGDMAELGEYLEAEHRKIGGMVVDVADMLVVVGEKAKWIFDEAKKNRMDESRLRDFKICEDSTEAGIYLKNIMQEGDIILVKGSQSMRMEKLIVAIMAEPEKRKDLLVRQDKEWEKR